VVGAGVFGAGVGVAAFFVVAVVDLQGFRATGGVCSGVSAFRLYVLGLLVGIAIAVGGVGSFW